MSVTAKELVKVVVDPDLRRAWETAPRPDACASLAATDNESALQAAQVVVDDAVRSHIDEFLKQISTSGSPSKPKYLIAEARLPTEGVDGGIELLQEVSVSADSGGDVLSGGPGTFLSARSVAEGTAVGKLTATTQGVAGADVQGKTIEPQCGGKPVAIGDNLSLAQDGETVVASAAGQVVYQDRKLFLRPAKAFESDLSEESGPVQAQQDVCVGGTVHHGKIICDRSISIGGAIDSSDAKVGDILFVHGGIVGSSAQARGNVIAKFCHNARIRSNGDIHVRSEIMHSTLHAHGKVAVPTGKLIGGETSAGMGIDVDVLGNSASIATPVQIGISADEMQRCRQIDEEIEQKQQMAKQIRVRVEPLMSNLKRLSAKHREQATELMFKADSMDAEVEELREEQNGLRQIGENGAVVFVRTEIHAGVLIAIEDLEARLAQSYEGPIRFEKRKKNGTWQIVGVYPERTGNNEVVLSKRKAK